MGRFDITPEVAAQWRAKFREAVQGHLDEEVQAAGTFRTTGSGTKYAISKTQAGALAYGAASLLGKSTPDCRLPIAPLSDASRETVRRAMSEAGLLS